MSFKAISDSLSLFIHLNISWRSQEFQSFECLKIKGRTQILLLGTKKNNNNNNTKQQKPLTHTHTHTKKLAKKNKPTINLKNEWNFEQSGIAFVVLEIINKFLE